MGDDLTVIDGTAAGAWMMPRLAGEIGSVTGQVPTGFEAYARIFHPAWDSEWNPVRWTEVATICGTRAHREMQWHAILGFADPDELHGSSDPGTDPSVKWLGSDPSLGAMDIPTLDALCEILADQTSDPKHCFFGLCTIQSWEEQFSAADLRQHYLKLPLGRDHIVLAGPLSAVDQIVRDWGKQSGKAVFVFTDKEGEAPPPKIDAGQWREREAPNLIWPDDQTWIVVSEVDFDSTLVGGSNELVEAIVGSPALEAWQVEPIDSLTADADQINRPSKDR
jgi:hypothetical protein